MAFDWFAHVAIPKRLRAAGFNGQADDLVGCDPVVDAHSWVKAYGLLIAAKNVSTSTAWDRWDYEMGTDGNLGNSFPYSPSQAITELWMATMAFEIVTS